MNTISPDIVGIGICTVDHLLRVPHMPQDNQTLRPSEYLQQSGGLTASALVAAARLGAKTKVIARIGDDSAGDYIRDDLNSEGVDTSKLLVEAGSETHISVILVNENTGDRSILSRWATGSPIRVDEITPDDITGAKILFVDTVTDTTMQAVQWAKDAGLYTVIDPSQPFEIVKDILPYITVPIVSEHFAKSWMPGVPPETVVQTLYDFGGSIAIVTLGENGSVVCTDHGIQRFPAYPVDVVDTTGAGDAFHGAFMVGLLEDDWDLTQKVRFASAVGAMNCRAMGGRTGLPNRQQVQDFLSAHGGN